MKNLFDLKAREEILSRISKLTPGTKAKWGKMNVNQGLWHMTIAFDISNGKLDPTPVNVPPMPKWLLKFFLLNMKPPKERAETFKEINAVANGINPNDFDTARNNLKKAVETFPTAFLIEENKLAGKFSKDDW